jgi:hypothetical protein
MTGAIIVTAPESAVTPPATEASASAAVEIATIEAERDIALATLNAESNEAQTTAVLENAALSDEEDVEWLRAELAALRERCATNEGALSSLETTLVSLSAQVGEMAGGLASLMASLTPPPPLETPPEEVPPLTVENPTEAIGGGEAGQRASHALETVPLPAETPRIRRKWL